MKGQLTKGFDGGGAGRETHVDLQSSQNFPNSFLKGKAKKRGKKKKKDF
jgi:hypothetical protein